jgi:hypothetical protein
MGEAAAANLVSWDLRVGIWELNDSLVHGTIFRNFITAWVRPEGGLYVNGPAEAGLHEYRRNPRE